MNFSTLVIILILITAGFSANAEGIHDTEIFNFTKNKIYFAVKETAQTGKVRKGQSHKIQYPEEHLNLTIYKSYGIENKSCQIEINDKLDVFVTAIDKSIKCSTRAERIPKEFP